MSLGAMGEEDELSRDEASVTDVGQGAALTAPAVTLERGTVLAGRYQIEKVIGRGGSGVVLQAFDRIAQTLVALKILKPELAAEPRWAERFARELRLGRQIQHPNVCRVYDIGEADGHRFLSMELATRGTLADVRAEAPQRPLADRIADARALVSGMAAIHAAGIIHRDVKPENLLRMEDGRVVVSDFGLATNPDQVPTVTVMVGTPSYMAPEMVMGDAASQRSDVWALGVTMHEILFGKRPEWDFRSSVRILRVPREAASSSVALQLAELCARCASDNVQQRPLDAAAVLTLFESAASVGRPISEGRARSKQHFVWGAVLAAVVISTVIFREALWTPASARSSQARDFAEIIQASGAVLDLTPLSKAVVELPGRVHCFAALPDGRSVHVVWGVPRRAEQISLDTAERTPSPLREETFARGCPQMSPRGYGILYETSDSAGAKIIMLSRTPDGSDARPVTRGTDPRWLPFTEEFLFDLDGRHAALFSLPSMRFRIIADGRNEVNRALVSSIVSPDGQHLALILADESYGMNVTVHEVPSLKSLNEFRLPASARDIAFTADGRYVRFTAGELPRRSRLVDVDWRTGRARNVGYIPNFDIRASVSFQSGDEAILSRSFTSDAWLDQGGLRVRLTTDGENYTVAASDSGGVLLSKRTNDGQFRIFAYDAKGNLLQSTPGPRDLMPTFGAKGASWAYVNAATNELIHCARGALCRPFHKDQGAPAWPVFAPAGDRVAYVTQINAPRMKVVRIDDGTVLDLGPARSECPAVWENDASLWAYEGTEVHRWWAEIDVRSSRKTGRRIYAPSPIGAEVACSLEAEEIPDEFRQRAQIQADERSVVRLAARRE